MSIYPTFDVNGRFTEAETFADVAHALEEPVNIKGFSATYDSNMYANYPRRSQPL